ncbi:transmembrane protein 179 isoform X2 [Biomphalaria pfeifferi]|uniref:Transmembrane protein 179 isoform X2 n=1 Tax=Biomphalaria pfeifferi TaxID=112525 RepID=A0AAD8FCW9_BIOPF|nr:transmembrane protein 179 isoform X2 [Biomphalaria pfeifferi]
MAGLTFLTNALIIKTRLVLLGALIFFSFFIISGVGIMTSKSGMCPLFNLKHWSKGVCDFAIAVAVVLQLLYCTFRFVPALLLFVGKLRAGAIYFDYSVQRCYILGELNFTIIVFVTAALLSSGVSSSCSSFDCNQVDWFPAVQAAQVGAWLSSIIYVILLALDIMALQRISNAEESSSEPPKVIYTAKGPSAGQVESDPGQGFANPIQDIYPVEDSPSSEKPSV